MTNLEFKKDEIDMDKVTHYSSELLRCWHMLNKSTKVCEHGLHCVLKI